MIRGSSRPGRRAGFTLLELGVSMTILAILAAIVAPPWGRYRARMRAYAAAQELRAELSYIQGRSIDLEQKCSLQINSAGQYSVFVADPMNPSTPQLYKQVNLGREGLTLTPATGWMVFAERGWVDAKGTTVGDAGLGGYTVYTLTVSAPGVVDVPVRVYLNGKVEIR